MYFKYIKISLFILLLIDLNYNSNRILNCVSRSNNNSLIILYNQFSYNHFINYLLIILNIYIYKYIRPRYILSSRY